MFSYVSALVFGVLLFVSTTFSVHATDYRVPATQRVTAQSIHITLDPSADDYNGTTTITLDLESQLPSLVLHWVDLDVTRIVLVGGGQERVLRAAPGDWDMHNLSDGQPIAPGSYALNIEFEGAYSTDALGLYKAEEQGVSYLFTQFEMSLARRAFPLVDEPDSKIAWTLALTVPQELTALSNTPVAEVATESDWRTYRYETTPPMSSYLLALAVGDFDATPIPNMPVPAMIYSPKGTAADIGFSARVTPPILKALEDYFGTAYPYKKLDFVAVPNFTFGAMENVGLVTYRSELLLNGDNPGPVSEASTVNVIAHELAHQWYGNLVTMAWWDDLWLNEAFASWMAYKVTTDLYPEYMTALYLPQGGAFGSDALGATRPIRKEVKTEQDIADSLGLNYTKGHAILNMLEQAMGSDAFRSGIRAYMREHSWQNTQASDLWRALDAHADFNVGAVAETFLNQAGFPLVNVSREGVISQRRFENMGANLAPQTWRIPVNILYGHSEGVDQTSVTLDAESQQLTVLADAEWVFPAAAGNGYYVWSMDEELYRQLLANTEALSDREKLALLINGERLLAAGEVTMGQHMSLLSRLITEVNKEIALDTLEAIRDVGEMYRGTHIEPMTSAWVRSSLSPWLASLGVEPVPNEDQGATKLRARVMRVLAQLGKDERLIKTLTQMADRYLDDPSSIQGVIAIDALRINALYNGSEATAKRYIDVYVKTKDALQKANLRRAMYFTDDAAIDVVLSAVADGQFTSGDISSVIGGLFYANVDQDALYALFQQYVDEIVQRLPEFYRPLMPQLTTAGCTASNSGRQKVLYGERGSQFQISLDKSQEATANCVDNKLRGLESAEGYLNAAP